MIGGSKDGDSGGDLGADQLAIVVVSNDDTQVQSDGWISVEDGH